VAGQTSLRTALGRDKECEKYLAAEALPRLAFVPLYAVNVLPAVAAVALVILRLKRVV